MALFERNSLSVNEIAKLSGIPRPSTYDVVEKLMAKGLVSAVSGKTKRYAVSAPQLLRDVSLNSLEMEIKELDRKREKTIARKRDVLDNIDTVIGWLGPVYENNRRNASPIEYIEILKNPTQIHYKFIELYSKAQKEVLGFVKPPFSWVTEKQSKEQGEAQFEAARRGVVKKGIIQMPLEKEAIEFFTHMTVVSEATRISTAHDEFRIADELPIKLFVFDGKTCLFTMEDPIKEKTSLTMLVTEHEAMAKSFTFLFEAYWKNGRDYYIVNNEKYYLPSKKEDAGTGGDK